MKKIIIFILVVFLNITIVSANDFIIEEDKVYINTSKAYISAYPHTITESGYVYFDILSKSYSGNIDMYFGFNVNEVKPKNASILLSGNWVSITSFFDHIYFNYDNFNKWYYRNDIPINSGITYHLKVYLEKDDYSNGKYGFAIKPSSLTFNQAITTGNLFYLDPWWNSTFETRIVYNVTNGIQNYPIPIYTQYNKSDRWVYSNGTNLYHWNQSTSKIWVNLSESGNYQIFKYINVSNVYSSASNGTLTFPFFDDFNDGNYSDKWTVISGSWTESGGVLSASISDTIRTINPVLTGYTNFSVHGRGQANGIYGYMMRMGLKSDSTPTTSENQYEPMLIYWMATGISPLFLIDNVNVGSGVYTASINTWYDGNVVIYPSDNHYARLYTTTETLLSTTPNITTDSVSTNNYISFFTADGASSYDWFFFRPYTLSEPIISYYRTDNLTQVNITDWDNTFSYDQTLNLSIPSGTTITFDITTNIETMYHQWFHSDDGQICIYGYVTYSQCSYTFDTVGNYTILANAFDWIYEPTFTINEDNKTWNITVYEGEIDTCLNCFYSYNLNKLFSNNFTIILTDNIKSNILIDNSSIYYYTDYNLYFSDKNNGSILFKLQLDNLLEIKQTDNYIYAYKDNCIYKISKDGYIERKYLYTDEIINIYTYNGD